jgi:hypothetical protein
MHNEDTVIPREDDIQAPRKTLTIRQVFSGTEARAAQVEWWELRQAQMQSELGQRLIRHLEQYGPARVTIRASFEPFLVNDTYIICYSADIER